MKKYICATLLTCLLGTICEAGTTRTTPPANNAKQRRESLPEVTNPKDQTDAYAIPLDSSEAEENEEEKALQREKKPVPARFYRDHK